MAYIVKIGNDIHTADIDAYYPSLGFGLYNAKDWEKVRERSTFIVQVLDRYISLAQHKMVAMPLMLLNYHLG